MPEESTNTLWNWYLRGQLPVDANGKFIPPTAGANVPNLISSESLSATGTVTAPAADATIVTLGNPPSGLYKVTVEVLMTGTGTVVAGDINNMALTVAGAVKFKVLCSAKDFVSDILEGYYRVNGSQPILVKAVGAGSANVDYSCTLIATRIAS